MVNNYALAAFFVGALFFLTMFVIRHIVMTFRMYHFFNEYVGYTHTHYVMNYKQVIRLYRCLSVIRMSVNGEDLFDIAMITYSRRLNDQDLYENTKAMLNAIDPNYYKKSKLQFKYTEADVQRYCFNLTGFSNRPDIVRFLLWLIVINPVAVRKLNEL